MSDLAFIRGLALRKAALARKGPGLHRISDGKMESRQSLRAVERVRYAPQSVPTSLADST